MTITGIQSLILEIFANQDLTTLGEVKLFLLKKQPIKDSEILEKLIISSCLDLEKAGILRIFDNKFFVLIKPLASFSQQIEISGTLAVEISKVLNLAAAKFSGNKDEELCNSLNISDKDIETLLFIAKEILKEEVDNKFDEFYLPPN